MGLPQDGAGGDAGRAVGVLGGDGVDGATAGGGEDHAQRLVLERRTLNAVPGVIGGIARAGDEQTVEIQRGGVDGAIELRRLPDLAEAARDIGRGVSTVVSTSD